MMYCVRCGKGRPAPFGAFALDAPACGCGGRTWSSLKPVETELTQAYNDLTRAYATLGRGGETPEKRFVHNRRTGSVRAVYVAPNSVVAINQDEEILEPVHQPLGALPWTKDPFADVYDAAGQMVADVQGLFSARHHNADLIVAAVNDCARLLRIEEAARAVLETLNPETWEALRGAFR
jgi:hypothetical protein